eukprot:Lithocolla_globosa_v1_NODE_3493_length_1657_cov_9.526217.p2 type:complete len:119 gc:universal NODE_3493_length_1657_cov_9.526217:449-93(-)
MDEKYQEKAYFGFFFVEDEVQLRSDTTPLESIADVRPEPYRQVTAIHSNKDFISVKSGERQKTIALAQLNLDSLKIKSKERLELPEPPRRFKNQRGDLIEDPEDFIHVSALDILEVIV